MYTNSAITIYNKHYDKTLRKDIYKRTVIDAVFFEEKLGSNRLTSGVEQADKVTIFVPFTQLQGFRRPKDYESTINTFTFQIGDKIVQNAVSYEITSKPSELDELFDVYTIHSVDIKDFGSTKMRHIELGLQ